MKTITNMFPDQWKRAVKALSATLLLLAGTFSHAQYCVPVNGGSGCADDIITNFALGTINNTTTCINAGYGDYSSISTDLPNLSTNVASVTSGSGSLTHGISIWIDFNNNQVFETSERVATTGNTVQANTTTNLTLDFTNATLGTHRLRVIYRYNQSGTQHDPCAGYTSNPWQEVEDYTVNIVPASCTPPVATYTLVPNCGSNQFSVDVAISSMGDATSIAIKEGATLLATATATGNYTVGNFASGTSHTLTLVHNNNSLCNITSPAQNYSCPPVNNEAAGAIALTVNNNYNCAAATTGTTIAATQSADPAPTCTAAGIDDDVWYSFVATSAAHRISFSSVSTGTMVAALYSGTPGSLSFVSGQCASSTLNATGLTPNTTYYIRAYNTATTSATQSNFTICVGTQPPPPANDNIAGAIALTVNNNYACGVTTPGTTASATASMPAPSCQAAGANDDVWFSFVATRTEHRISLTNVSGSSDMNMVIYASDGVTEVSTGGSCANVSTKNLTGLTIGATYYVRVYTWSSTATVNSSFTICVGSPSPMSFVSSAAVQPSSAIVTPGSVNQQILRANVVVTGSLFPLSVTELTFNTNGTTNPSDILNARVYYTGTSTSFSTATLFGTAVANPNGTFTVTGNQALAGGENNTNNYFHLAYDIACGATPGNIIDAEYTAVTAGLAYTPGTTAPVESRPVAASYTTIADGDWNAPSTWLCGIVPSNPAAVTLNHNVTITTSGNTCGNLTIASGKSLTLSAGDLTMGNPGGDNRTLRVNGTLTVSNGTLNANGNVFIASSGTFNQSGGNINIDGNAGGVAANSLDSSTYMLYSTSSNINWTGGILTLVDPHAVNSGTSYVLAYDNSSSVEVNPAHTIRFGDGISADPTALTNGFYVNNWVGSGKLNFGNVIINGPSTGNRRVSSVYTLPVKGSLWLTNNGVLNLSGVVVGKDLAVDAGSMLITTGTLSLAAPSGSSTTAATVPQTISGAGSFRNHATTPTANFTSLTFNNTSAAGITFANANTLLSGTNTGTVSNTLTHTAGTVNLGNNTLIVGTGPTASGTYNSPAGIIIGKVKRWISTAAGSRVFGIGDATGKKTATINFTTAPATGGSLTAEWLPGNPGTGGLPLTEGTNTYAYVSGKGYWRISAADGLAGGTYTATFNGTGITDISDYSTLTFGKRADASAAWSLDGTRVVPTGSNSNFTISRTGISTGFSEFGILSGTIPLPVVLEHFSGKNTGSINVLEWETAEEKNFSHFELERSADGGAYHALATIPAKGTAGNSYAYTDERPFTGRNIYRLRMIDKDGRSMHSSAVELYVKTGKEFTINVYPNPVQQQLQVDLTGIIDGSARLQVLDIMGKALLTLPVASGKTIVDMQTIPPGNYIIRYTDNSRNEVIKVTKK